MLFSQYRKMQFTLELHKAIERNRKGNTKFYYHLKDLEFNSILVSKLKTMKIQSRDMNVIFAMQKNAIYSQNFGDYKKTNREGNVKFCYHSKDLEFCSILVSKLKTGKKKCGLLSNFKRLQKKNKESNTKIYYHSKDSEFDSLLVSKIVMKNVIFTIGI